MAIKIAQVGCYSTFQGPFGVGKCSQETKLFGLVMNVAVTEQ